MTSEGQANVLGSPPTISESIPASSSMLGSSAEIALADWACRTEADEWANTLTHGVAFLLSLAGLYFMLGAALGKSDGYRFAGCLVFGVSMVLLYASSTLYHGARDLRYKGFFRVCDHVGIYLLIAGTYTPFMLTHLRGPWGWSLLVAVWTIAAVGIYGKIFAKDLHGPSSAAPYLAMGWIAIIAIKPILETFPTGCLLLMVLGGVCYTAGVYFYVRDNTPFYHAVWHVFVMLGTLSHFCAILFFLDRPIAA